MLRKKASTSMKE
ncbi:UNVERIFIED_CONTAM: hypothetical protein GTU68_043546 [Idotea baltica]|nr:hypothetical protein [Idotea baltica]